LTVGALHLLGNPCHPILKPIVRPLSTLDHFLTSLSRIVEFAGSGNFQFLVVVSCARYLQISFQVYAICIQLLQKHTEKDLARKWNIYCRFEYIGPSFPSSILNQILVSFSPLLSLSRYLVIFSENVSMHALADSQVHICARAFISRLRPTASHSMPSHFSDHRFPGRRALYCTSIVL
jgi:hypothetical protein